LLTIIFLTKLSAVSNLELFIRFIAKMNKTKLYDLEDLIKLRKDLHMHPEIGYHEYRTADKIIEYLFKLGINENQIRRVARTGIIVDIYGKGQPSGKPFCIAIRADMDGLPIQEVTPDIEYRSKTNVAHMCGHDGHITCLLAGAAKILEKIDQIPSDKCVRLLFQPAEEGLGGAFIMIQEGAMDGVDEVYGMHNWPTQKPGKMLVKPEYFMPIIHTYEVRIIGKGGRASQVEGIIDPLNAVIDIQKGIKSLVTEYKEKGIFFTFSLPYVRTNESPDIVGDVCVLKGFLRSFELDFTVEFKKKIHDLIISSCRTHGCQNEMKILNVCPAIYNTHKETEHVIRVGKKVLGEDKVTSEGVPALAGEDFSYFTKLKPGCFFFLSSQRTEGDTLHSDNFDINDDVIPIAADVWLGLVEDRFDLHFE